jgi:hypothetical protein
MILTGHYPSTTPTMRWTGSSRLTGRRWIGDEVRPNELDYYVVTVTWKPSGEVIKADLECPEELRVPADFPRPPARQRLLNPVSEQQVRTANVRPNATDEGSDADGEYLEGLPWRPASSSDSDSSW